MFSSLLEKSRAGPQGMQSWEIYGQLEGLSTETKLESITEFPDGKTRTDWFEFQVWGSIVDGKRDKVVL